MASNWIHFSNTCNFTNLSYIIKTLTTYCAAFSPILSTKTNQIRECIFSLLYLFPYPSFSTQLERMIAGSFFSKLTTLNKSINLTIRRTLWKIIACHRQTSSLRINYMMSTRSNIDWKYFYSERTFCNKLMSMFKKCFTKTRMAK